METTHPLLQKLNSQQRVAVTTDRNAVLVLAGPGSGKTRVLTHRIAWMLGEMRILPWQVMAVTFTNKAAHEMRARVDKMLGSNAAREMALGTFHAICARILRREATEAGLAPDYVIFDTDDQLSLMTQVIHEMNLDDKRYRPRALLGSVSAAKNELIPPSGYPTQTYYDEIVARAYARYQELLRNNRGLDFDDLLMETAQLLRDNETVRARYGQRYRYLLVDEFQDTNMAQYIILRHLTPESRNLYVVADEDQSIYSWRGADYRNIQRLRTDFPELFEVLLEENYRSTQVILDGAQSIIARNTDRTPKHLFTRKTGGAPLTLHESYNDQDEAEYVCTEIKTLVRGGRPYSTIAVMYRTNAQSRALEEALIRQNIPYRLIGAIRFYSRKEVKDVLAYLRLAQNPDDDVSFLRVVNTPSRSLGAQTLAKIAAQAESGQTSRFGAAQALLATQSLARRTHNALREFVELLQAWRSDLPQLTVVQLMDRLLRETGYEKFIRDGSEEGESRWENVLALRAVVADAPDITLADFLTEVTLVADVDELEANVEAVTLLTLHSAKGLEYPVVFITGLEEGMLPHSRSLESAPQIAEERRLLYVGMTRAEELLYLTYAFRRNWYGSNEPSSPSRFLEDLPDSLLGRPRRARTESRAESGRASDSGWGVGSWSGKRQREAAPPPTPTYRSGQRVRHAHYGEGMVLQSEMDGRSEMVTVMFPNGIGVKRLLAGMAPMEALPER